MAASGGGRRDVEAAGVDLAGPGIEFERAREVARDPGREGTVPGHQRRLVLDVTDLDVHGPVPRPGVPDAGTPGDRDVPVARCDPWEARVIRHRNASVPGLDAGGPTSVREVDGAVAGSDGGRDEALRELDGEVDGDAGPLGCRFLDPDLDGVVDDLGDDGDLVEFGGLTAGSFRCLDHYRGGVGSLDRDPAVRRERCELACRPGVDRLRELFGRATGRERRAASERGESDRAGLEDVSSAGHDCWLTADGDNRIDPSGSRSRASTLRTPEDCYL